MRNRMQGLGIALLGLGTVGQGVARLLDRSADRIARRSGRKIECLYSLVRSPEKPRDVA